MSVRIDTYQAQEEAQVSGKEQEQELVQALEQHASVVQFLHLR